MRKIANIVFLGGAGILLSGCMAATGAGLAIQVVSTLVEPASSPMRNPMAHQPGQSVEEALSRLSGEVDPRCLEALDGHGLEAKVRDAAVHETGDGMQEVKSVTSAPAAPGSRIRLVCLPGNDRPIPMLLHSPSGPDGAGTAQVDGSSRPARRTAPAWDFGVPDHYQPEGVDHGV